MPSISAANDHLPYTTYAEYVLVLCKRQTHILAVDTEQERNSLSVERSHLAVYSSKKICFSCAEYQMVSSPHIGRFESGWQNGS